VLGYIIASLFAVLLLSAFALGHTRDPGRTRLRGGKRKRAVSLMRSRVVAYTTPATPTRAASTSSYLLPGGASAEWVTPRELRDPSRLTGRGWSTAGTEALGASGRPPTPAASPSTWPPPSSAHFTREAARKMNDPNLFCRCGTHTVHTPCYANVLALDPWSRKAPPAA
jgi:hypothetical protein